MKEQIEQIVGAPVLALDTCRGAATRTPAGTGAFLEDGRSVFVKSAVDELSAGWLRTEIAVYSSLRGSFLPVLHGWAEHDGLPLLVLEDWATRTGRRRGAQATSRPCATALAEVAATRRPPGWSRCRASAGVRVARGRARSRAVPLARPLLALVARDAPAGAARGRRARAVRGRPTCSTSTCAATTSALARRSRAARRLELGMHGKRAARPRLLGAFAARRGRAGARGGRRRRRRPRARGLGRRVLRRPRRPAAAGDCAARARRAARAVSVALPWAARALELLIP